LTWRDLKGVRFHAAGHDHDRIVAESMAGLPADEQLVPGQVFDNISTALGLASVNLGITLCPAYVEPLANAFGLEMRRVVDPEFTRYLALYRPANRNSESAAQRFADCLREQLEPDAIGLTHRDGVDSGPVPIVSSE
jgi:DNA-binding transcriptional LysR family regulator